MTVGAWIVSPDVRVEEFQQRLADGWAVKSITSNDVGSVRVTVCDRADETTVLGAALSHAAFAVLADYACSIGHEHGEGMALLSLALLTRSPHALAAMALLDRSAALVGLARLATGDVRMDFAIGGDPVIHRVVMPVADASVVASHAIDIEHHCAGDLASRLARASAW